MVNKRLKIAVLPGDGIGAEVTYAATPLFAALNLPITLQYGEIGWANWKKEGNPIPDRTWKLIAESDTVLLGATTSKPPREARQELSKALQQNAPNYVSPIIQLRQKLDLFANVRPCFNILGEGKEFDFCIIRENTQGLYSGFDYHPIPEPVKALIKDHPDWNSLTQEEISCSLRLQSRSGLLRLFHFAFNYAMKKNIKRLTLADKPNVLRQSAQFTREIFEHVAADYPTVQTDIHNVDALALWMIRRPETLGVVVAENMFGDILSDVGAGVMGGLGFAPSANIGHKGAYFEPVHGSAPRVKSNSANPSAMFLSLSLLLDHVGYPKEAQRVIAAVSTVVKEARFITYDLGGRATTQEMANAIIDHSVGTKLSIRNSNKAGTSKWQEELQSLSASEISDALDACGVEGALLPIKTLVPGLKLVGPAYTIRYEAYESKPETFKGASNYIDNIPAGAVVVIDNQGLSDCSIWGGILTQMALKKELAGLVAYGMVRDVKQLQSSEFPVFCLGTTMRSGKNRVYKTNEQSNLEIEGVVVKPGDIIFADDNGVLTIPFQLLDEVIAKARQIKVTEKKILAAIAAGVSLEKARSDYHYDQPWKDANAEAT